jgi:hypothetical protein
MKKVAFSVLVLAVSALAGGAWAGENTRLVAAYVDGKLHAGVWNGQAGNSRLVVPAAGRFGLLFRQGMQDGRVVFDNSNVLTHVRTGFSGRTSE